VKKILLLMTSDVRICDCVKDNLTHLGYQVLMIENVDFKYKNFKDRIVNFYKKTINKDKSYKRQLIREYQENNSLKILSNQDYFDYLMVIRPDKFSSKVLHKAKEISKISVAYQWDGISRFPEVIDTIDYFDKFYVFDINDLKLNSNKFSHTTNFYFDCYPEILNENIEYDVYFIGTYDDRISDLIRICLKLKSFGLKLNILLSTSPKINLKKYDFISYLEKPLTYYENLKLLSKSKIIIDLAHKNIHSGLSFRAFESIGYDKKLITNNLTIKEMDFYNPKNIFLFDENLDNLQNFILQEYIPIPSRIKEKHGFKNWFNQLFDIEPNTIITPNN
jgi:hypothetical protein